MKSRNVVNGIVRKIEIPSGFLPLSFVTLDPLDQGWSETRIPIYFKISKEYMNRVVDIIRKEKGFFWNKELFQKIQSSNCSSEVSIKFSYINEIHDAYNYLESIGNPKIFSNH